MEGSEIPKKSALDSPYLLAAMGVNSNKPRNRQVYSRIFSSYKSYGQGFNKLKKLLKVYVIIY